MEVNSESRCALNNAFEGEEKGKIEEIRCVFIFAF